MPILEQFWKQVGALRKKLEVDDALFYAISTKRAQLQKEADEQHQRFIQKQQVLLHFFARKKAQGIIALPPPSPPLHLPDPADPDVNEGVDSVEAIRAKALII